MDVNYNKWGYYNMKPKYYIIITLILIMVISFFFLDVIVKKNQKIAQFTDSMTDYNSIISEQIGAIVGLEKRLSRTQIVKISFYHPASRGINSDSDHKNTATMTRPVVGRTVAISDELFHKGWLGAKIYVDGIGIFRAEDRMSSNITGEQIDICVSSHKQAMALGIKNDVVAVKL